MIPHTELLALLEKASPAPWYVGQPHLDDEGFPEIPLHADIPGIVRGQISPLVVCLAFPTDAQKKMQMANAALIAALRTHAAELIANSRRYEWLKEHACNSLHLTRDGDHACNYVTAKEWIERMSHEDFEDDDPAEVQKMKDTNTIWRLQIYPNTPVGFNVWNASTLDAVVDAAIDDHIEEEGAK